MMSPCIISREKSKKELLDKMILMKKLHPTIRVTNGFLLLHNRHIFQGIGQIQVSGVGAIVGSADGSIVGDCEICK